MPHGEALTFLINCFVALFAIVNPVGNAPLFLSFTGNCTPSERKQTAFRAALTCLIVLFVFVFLGKGILYLFRVTIPAFQIAGGALIFIIGLTMLHAFRLWVKSTPSEEQEAVEKEEVGVIPLGIPILAGPGAITTAMVFAFEYAGPEGKIMVCIAVILTSLISYFVFAGSNWLMKIMGNTGINILTRLMGLLLTVKAVQFALAGLTAAFPGLFK